MLHTKFVQAAVTGSLLVAVASCDTGAIDPQQVNVDFVAQVNGSDFTCGGTYSGIGTGPHDYKVTDFRMYIHDLYLEDPETGVQYPVELAQDGVWQLDNVAMLDFEDAGDSADCNGTPETNSRLAGTATVPLDFDRSNTRVCFTVGLPFEKNHLDESTADSPLNASGMLWAWKIGRKYVRIDGVGDPAGTGNAFNLHLGAQGDCGTLGATQEPEQECSVPNTIQACVAEFNLDSDAISVDPARVLEANDVSINLSPTVMTPNSPKPGCQSFIDDDDCEEIMPRFGLDYSYGRSLTGVPSTYNSGQRLLRKL